MSQSVQRLGRHGVICPNPNCGYTGKAKRKGRHNTGTFVGLLILTLLGLVVFFPVGLIAGLVLFIYIMATGFGVNLVCPRCRTVCR